jgi:photosystem II stability/assembly factor-like uncharacterized protein
VCFPTNLLVGFKSIDAINVFFVEDKTMAKSNSIFLLIVLLTPMLTLNWTSSQAISNQSDDTSGVWHIFPSPTLEHLESIDMLSSNNGWAVGDNGVILHWDGSEWQVVPSPTQEMLNAVVMLSENDGWIAGNNGVILQWDGMEWKIVPSPRAFFLMAIDMLSPADGWIVGMGGTLMHWDGGDWTQAPGDYLPHIEDVFMMSSSSGWVVGGDVNIETMYWDGARWSGIETPDIQGRLLSVWMNSMTDGWAGGRNGVMVRWNGSTWTEYVMPSTSWIEDILFIAPDDGWAVGGWGYINHWNGTEWSLVNTPLSSGWLNGIDMLSLTEGWAVGDNGTILRYSPPQLHINYPTGAPGSYFTVTGEYFPAESTANVIINNHSLGTIQSDISGGFTFLLDTSQADPGAYTVNVSVNPSASISFEIASDAPIRPQDGDGTIFLIPTGIALDSRIYLPMLIK